MHAFGKITLFFAAGAIYTAALEAINDRGGIKLHGVLEGLAKMEVASYDFADVVPCRVFIMVTAPASLLLLPQNQWTRSDPVSELAMTTVS